MSALLVITLTFIVQVEVKKQATKKRMYLKIVVNQRWYDKSSIIHKQQRISLYILTSKQATDGTSSYLRSELPPLSARQENKLNRRNSFTF